LDADPSKLFLGAIDPMNTQDLCPRCGRSGFARADVMSWKAFSYVRSWQILLQKSVEGFREQ
jgi:hypothetical protein